MFIGIRFCSITLVRILMLSMVLIIIASIRIISFSIIIIVCSMCISSLVLEHHAAEKPDAHHRLPLAKQSA